MKTFGIRRFATLLLALSLLVTLAAPALARETSLFPNFPQELDFKTLKPGKPDSAAFMAKALQLESAMAKTDNSAQVEKLLDELFTLYKQFETDYSVFNYHYTCDPNARAKDYVAWSNASTLVSDRFASLIGVMADSPYQSVTVSVLGADAAEYLSSAEASTPEELALLSRHAELVSQYWTLASQRYTTTYNGVVYDEDKLNTSDLDYDTYITLLLDLAKQSNAAVGPVFVEIVQVLNEYAALLGYDNYADLAYLSYGRDYTPEDAAALHDLVKTYFVPLVARQNVLTAYSPAALSSAAECDALFQDTDQADLVAMVQPHMDSISSEYADLFDYMLRCNLLDIEASDTKNMQAYTSPLPAYDSAYIYAYHYGMAFDASTLVHEFGHFAEFCFSGAQYAGMSLDLAEVNSQGLEVLYYPYAADMVGEDAALGYLNGSLGNLFSSVIQGSLVDEFLQAVYTTPDLTLDKANRIYHDVAESYGQQMADDTYAYGWTNINHNFEAPFYYLSYATSALATLDLLSDSVTDYNAACDTYLALTKQGSSAKYGFRTALTMAGFDDVFAEKTVASIANSMEDYLYGTVYDVRFADLEGDWARDNALFCAASGLFTGDQNGNFLPKGTLTRAQTAMLLWRMNGSPVPETTGAFTDVPQDVWYAQAVDWCAENGVISGTSAAEAVFSPDAALSRQELAVLLYRMNGAPELPEGPGLAFSDADSVAGWASDGIAWAVEYGIMSGRTDGTLAPTASITRGEAATLLVNYYT